MNTKPSWSATKRVLYRGGTVHAPGSPFATAMLVDGPMIAWVGDDAGAVTHAEDADEVVDLQGALVTPGFVDAHVHATSAGMTLAGLDLTMARSLAEALEAIQSAAAQERGRALIGHGWDDTNWPEGRPPTREELDRASWGSVVYLSRVDVHSAVVSSALIAMAPQCRFAEGFDDSGWLRGASHHVVREAVLGGVGAGERRRAQRLFRAHAASLGIVAVHEMAGPTISSEDDVAELLSLAAMEPGPLVAAYWGELADRGGIERARSLGAVGAGGDLFIDGALGSRTACLRAPYADAHDTSGAQFISADEVARHLIAASAAGLQGGFHVIGDRAADIVVDGISSAGAEYGAAAIRARAHRIEHAELLDDRHIAALATFGITASMQPMFDALWGGDGGMYERRIGPRSREMNRIADLHRAGVLVAFGSDAPVTEMGPWAAVRAAVHHHDPTQRISARAAFTAHTRGGWRSIGDAESGVLMPGAPAHYVVWQADDLVVQAPDDRVARWSTDDRSGVPGLPALELDAPLPTALRTAVSGAFVHDLLGD